MEGKVTLECALRHFMYKDMDVKINNVELHNEPKSASVFLILSRRKA